MNLKFTYFFHTHELIVKMVPIGQVLTSIKKHPQNKIIQLTTFFQKPAEPFSNTKKNSNLILLLVINIRFGLVWFGFMDINHCRLLSAKSCLHIWEKYDL